MSPAPFRTSTWIAHGFGSVAAWATTGSTAGVGLPDERRDEHERDECHQRRGERGDADEACGGVDVERPWRDRKAGELARLAPVDLERGGDQQRRLDRAVRGREAVDAPFLEPLDLVRRQAGALRGLLDRQLAVQPRGRKRAPVGDDLGVLRCGVDELHLHLHRFVGRLPEPFREILREVDVSGGAEVVAGDEQRLVRAKAFVRDVLPRRAVDDQGVAADAAVARSDERRAALPPALRARARSRRARAPGRLRARPPRPRPPGRARRARSGARRPGPRSQSGQWTAPSSWYAPETTTTWSIAAEPFEDGGKEQALLRRAEPRRGAGGEDDRRDQDSCTVTFSITTGFDGGPSPTPERVDRRRPWPSRP